MNADNTTPRPWGLERDGITLTMGGQIVATAIAPDGASIAEQRANAALIVRAVNSFDAMRAALRPFAALLSAHHADMPDNRPVFGINDALFTVGDLHAARAALALADTDRSTTT